MGCMIGEQHPQAANAGHFWLKHYLAVDANP
jgi:hypothetical protein